MKRHIFAALFTVLLVSLFSVQNSFAQKKVMKMDHMTGKMGLFKDLNLTKEQKDQIDKFRFDHQNAAIDLRAQIEKNRLQIKELMKSANLDESKIRSLVKQNGDLQEKLKESALNMWFKSYNVLDDKQKEIWRERAPFLEGGGRMMIHSMGTGAGNDMGMGIHKRVKIFSHDAGASVDPGMMDNEETVHTNIDE